MSREKVAALDKVQERQAAGKSVLDKANQLINGKVQQEQERQRAAELARREAAKRQQKAKTQTVQKVKTIEKGFSLGR